MCKVIIHKDAIKDLENLKQAKLSDKAKQLVESLKENPYCKPVEKLKGNLKGFFSKRINLHHRLVYSVNEDKKEVLIVSMWSHYGD